MYNSSVSMRVADTFKKKLQGRKAFKADTGTLTDVFRKALENDRKLQSEAEK